MNPNSLTPRVFTYSYGDTDTIIQLTINDTEIKISQNLLERHHYPISSSQVADIGSVSELRPGNSTLQRAVNAVSHSEG